MQSTFGTQTMFQPQPIILLIISSNNACTVLEQLVQTNSVCQRIRNTYLQLTCNSNLAPKFLCNLIGEYTKHSQTKIEFVQITGQAVMHASEWLKLEHSWSTSWRLHGAILPASLFNSKIC